MENYKEFLNDLHTLFKKYDVEYVYVDDWNKDIVFSTGYSPSPGGKKLCIQEYFSYAYGTYFSGVLNEKEDSRHKYIIEEKQ